MKIITKISALFSIKRFKEFLSYNTTSIELGKNFYNSYINVKEIICRFNNSLSEDQFCYKYNFEIHYDFSNFEVEDYLYIKNRLTSDLSSRLNVYVNCTVDTDYVLLEDKKIPYIKITVFIRKQIKECTL